MSKASHFRFAEEQRSYSMTHQRIFLLAFSFKWLSTENHISTVSYNSVAIIQTVVKCKAKLYCTLKLNSNVKIFCTIYLELKSGFVFNNTWSFTKLYWGW